MKFLKRLNAVLSELKLGKKAKDCNLDDADWAKIASKYKEKFDSDFYDDQKDYQAALEKANAHDSVMQLIKDAGIGAGNDGEGAGSEGGDDGDGAGDGDGDGEGGEATNQQPDLMAAVTALISQNKQMVTALQAVTKGKEKDKPAVAVIGFDATGIAMPHSDTHLFGVENAIYDRSHRWNKLFMNPKAIHSMSEATKAEQKQFMKTFDSFAAMVAQGINNLHDAGQLSVETLRSSSNPDLDALTNAGLGDQFVQFRVRELIARVLELPDPFDIFPMRSGIQDRDLITNDFVDELTQAWQESEAALKGGSSMEPEMGYVDDAMILSKFGSFKTMERKYIAYLNTNGSDSVKWGMIERSLFLYMKQARKELFQRTVRGIFLKPVEGTPGHFLNASTGVINRIFLYHIEKKLRGIEDASMATYDNTGSVMAEAVIEFGDWLKDNLDPLGLEVEDNICVYLNKNHQQWMKKGIRSLFGLQQDFKSIDVSVIPDTNIEIVWVPNMNDYRVMWATVKTNLQALENIPGEMFKFYLERRLKNVYVQSEWKEGTAAGYAGRLAATKAELDARDWDQQLIWFPKPFTELADGATTGNANNGFWFKTVENAGATAITTIENRKPGVMYVIECGHTTNASTIAKAGDFSEITAAFNPVAVGDCLVVAWDAGALKFKEICRVVNGVLSYNAATTPNAIGAR